jgi:DNA-binding transcriptional LysR family regulator
MRIEALKSFVAVVRAGSYVASGDQLFMSPTTVHGHIRALEQELGTTLVTFSGRTLHLTKAGTRFLLFAERTLLEQDQMEADIFGLGRPNATRLRIVSLPGPSVHLLPPVIRAFHEMRRDVVIAVTSSVVGETVAALVSGQADVALLNDIHTAEVAGSFGVTPVYEDDLVMVIRGDFYEPPDIALLNKYPVATQSSSSGYRRYVEVWAREQGVSLNTAFEHSSFDGLLQYVMQGGCIGMMGSYVATTSPVADRVRILDLPGFHHRRSLIMAHAVNPGPLISDFIHFFREFHDPSREATLAAGSKIS